LAEVLIEDQRVEALEYSIYRKLVGVGNDCPHADVL
jgi:hypothetical protein